MSLEVKRFKRMYKACDENTQLTVSGYMRHSQTLLPSNENPYYTIPDLVTYILLAFYCQREYWDDIAKECVLSEDKRTITRTHGQGWENTSFVNIEVDSMEQCVARWYIRIDKAIKRHIMIGIVGDRTNTDQGLVGKYDYGYWGNNGHAKYGGAGWFSYGALFGQNEFYDVICCILDLKNKEISWCKNGKNQGIACRNIEYRKGLKYRLGISMYFGGSSCSIIKFQKD